MKHISYFFKRAIVSIICISAISFAHATDKTTMRGITAMQATAEMAPGVNLWNTLDANTHWDDYSQEGLDSETCWGQPYTTFEMIELMADRGFKTLRVPVTWYNHMGGYPEYTINQDWMDRVEEVVNYGLDNGMYVVLNIHHEDYHEGEPGKWLIPTYEMQDSVTYQLEKVWTQIATRFKDYGDYLIFETMNEPREVGSKDEWNGGSAEHREVINAYNLAAVNTIRAIEGNNETRFIMMPQVGANTASAKANMVIPNDDPNAIVSVHAYYPYEFCLKEDGPDTWGSTSEVRALENEIKTLAEKFIDNGQAVVMGEWGAVDKDNYAERVNYYKIYSDLCAEYGITPITWMYSIDRRKLTWKEPLIEEAILQAFNDDNVPAEEIVLNSESVKLMLDSTFQLTAEIQPADATIQDIIWTSSDKDVAVVTSSGLIKTKGTGTVTISATTLGKTVEMEVEVEAPVATDDINALNFYVSVTSDDIVVKCPSCADSESSVSVIDIYGKTVQTVSAENLFVAGECTITAKDLNTGVYFIKVENSQAQAVQKLIYSDK